MHRLFYTIALAAAVSCGQQEQPVQTAPKTSALPATDSVPATTTATGRHLSADSLWRFVKHTPARIITAKAAPFDQLQYNKVIIYEFEGDGVTYPRVIRNGNFVPVINKQTAPDQETASDLINLLGDKNTYGNGTSSCFEPHLGIVLFRDTTIVMDISVCLGCNFLNTSIPIPAETALIKKINGYDTVLRGFSKTAQKKLKALCNRYGYKYLHSDRFDR